jgi:hypothetical protein
MYLAEWGDVMWYAPVGRFTVTEHEDTLVIHARDGAEVSVRRAWGETSDAWLARALQLLEQCVYRGGGGVAWGGV